eukprot:3499473-Rhodomonas_salina.1
MSQLSLTVIVGPSVFEAQPYTKWSSVLDHFGWDWDDRPLFLLDWLPIESRPTVLASAVAGGPLVVLGRHKTLNTD